MEIRSYAPGVISALFTSVVFAMTAQVCDLEENARLCKAVLKYNQALESSCKESQNEDTSNLGL